MILLMNTFLTHPRMTYQRGHVPGAGTLEIFLYTVASLAAIPYWSAAIFHIRLDDFYQPYGPRIRDFIREEFGDRAIIYDWRNERQSQWRETIGRLMALPDDLVWYSCNHDHVFMDYGLEGLDRILGALAAEPEARKSAYYSHWPEFCRVTRTQHPTDHTLRPDGVIAARFQHMDSIQIVSKPLLHSWWCEPDYGDRYLPRSDWEDVYQCSPFRCFVPSRELCRHFDGYSHLFDITSVPPLSIPPGFFEKQIKILYCSPERREGWVHVNPLYPHYRTVDPEGVDYKWVLDDIPLFWKNRVAAIEIARWFDPPQLVEARNRAVRQYMTCFSAHSCCGGYQPDEAYIQHSMRPCS
jgi:hypothetical protein